MNIFLICHGELKISRKRRDIFCDFLLLLHCNSPPPPPPPPPGCVRQTTHSLQLSAMCLPEWTGRRKEKVKFWNYTNCNMCVCARMRAWVCVFVCMCVHVHGCVPVSMWALVCVYGGGGGGWGWGWWGWGGGRGGRMKGKVYVCVYFVCVCVWHIHVYISTSVLMFDTLYCFLRNSCQCTHTYTSMKPLGQSMCWKCSFRWRCNVYLRWIQALVQHFVFHRSGYWHQLGWAAS